MKYAFDGKNYKTLSACYKDNIEKSTVGIATVSSRLKKGWSLKKALLHPKEKTGKNKFGDHLVEGKVYESLPSVAREYNITENAIYQRYARGHRGDDLIPIKKRKTYVEPIGKIDFRFYAGGIGYNSQADACRKLEVKYGTYKSRRRKGLSIEQALEIEKIRDGRALRGEEYDLDGQLMSISELSESHGISYSTVKSRLERGATIRQALNLDKITKGSLRKQSSIEREKRQSVSFEVDGRSFTSYKDLGDVYGISQYTVRQRIVDYGYTPEEAVKLDIKSKPVTVEGVKYPSMAAVAEAYELTYNVLLSRLNNGTLKQALGIDIKENLRTIRYAGKTYKSLVELADDQGIKISTLRARMNYGRSLEEAIQEGFVTKGIGRYNLTNLERDDEKASKPAELYFVRIFINDKNHFKIGITTQTVNIRLKKEAYNFEIIKIVQGTLLNCYKLEQEILSYLSDKRDPEVDSTTLAGYTEIRILNECDIEIVSKKMDFI